MNKDDQIAVLLDRVAELEELLGADIDGSLQFRKLGLSLTECRVLNHLVKRTIASRTGLLVLLYGGESDVNPRIFNTWICRIRNELEPHGVRIRTEYGVGWSMTPDDKVKLADVIATAPAKFFRGRERLG
jgi:hypothetical protein